MNKKFFQQLSAFFERLSSKPKLGGLQITDSALLYVEFDGKVKTAGVRLQPGAVREGRVVDSVALLAALNQLHAAINPDEKAIVPTNVVLPAHGVYTQSFNVPNVGRERLVESAQLNIQMISPMAADTSYMSWQVMQETQDQFEILGVFAERTFVDSFRVLLEQAHFSAVSIEFPSLALARLAAQTNGANPHPCLLLQVTGEGINLSILRNNGLYFDYFRSWRSVQGEERTITREKFERVVGEEVQKVINFTVSRFKETPQKLFAVAPGFEADIQAFIQAHFSLAIVFLTYPSADLTSQWYVAIGSALREQESRTNDRLITLAPAGSGSFFYREQAMNFIVLWRGITAAVLGTFLIFFAGGAYVLAREQADTKNDLSIFSANVPTKELSDLQKQVGNFNTLVGMIRSTKERSSPWSVFFSRIDALSRANDVVIERVDTTTLKESISMLAYVSGYDGLTKFKKALEAEKDFSNVKLSVAAITQRPDGSVEFQISFNFAAIATTTAAK